jgi:hypothetical protein
MTTAGGYASIQKRGEGVGMPSQRREEETETKVRQQKSEDKDATRDRLLKYLDATLATYV